MHLNLIGLTGRSGTGKDTFAGMLNKHLNFEPYSFAGPLKDACCLLFGWTRHQIDHDREFKESIDPRWGFSPRKAMQLMGTEYGRQMLRDDLWIHMAQNRLNETRKKGLLVTDVRFENEANWVRNNGGIVIHIDRNNLKKVIGHSSENGVEFREGDIKVHNSGSLDRLQEKASDLFQKILRK